MKLTAKQTQAYKLALYSEKNIILFGGAIRGGKTYCLLLTFISLASKYKNSRWVIIRESLPTLQKTTLVTFNELLKQGLDTYIQDFNRSTNTVTFKNGSQLIFMSESYDQDKELNRFRGLECNGFGLEEVNELREETFNKCIERAGSWLHAGIVKPLIFSTCNPTNGWVKDLFYNRWVENNLPPKWSYIPSLISDNTFLPQSYIDSLKENMTPQDYRKFVEGDWNIYKVSNAFATQFDELRHTHIIAEFDTNKQLVISIDFNLNPFAVTFYHYFNDSNGYNCYQIDEAEIVGGNIPKMIELIRQRYNNQLSNCLLTGDAMGKRGDISQRDNASYYMQLMKGLGLSERQLKISGNPTHENSRADVNYFLYHFKNFYINPKCKNSIYDLKYVECDDGGKIKKTNRKELNQRADYLDTFRYFVNNIAYKWIEQHQKNNRFV
jgi:phage terminase large subunit